MHHPFHSHTFCANEDECHMTLHNMAKKLIFAHFVLPFLTQPTLEVVVLPLAYRGTCLLFLPPCGTHEQRRGHAPYHLGKAPPIPYDLYTIVRRFYAFCYLSPFSYLLTHLGVFSTTNDRRSDSIRVEHTIPLRGRGLTNVREEKDIVFHIHRISTPQACVNKLLKKKGAQCAPCKLLCSIPILRRRKTPNLQPVSRGPRRASVPLEDLREKRTSHSPFRSHYR